MTVAMIIISTGKGSVPERWYHDPVIQDEVGETVAMKIIKYWTY